MSAHTPGPGMACEKCGSPAEELVLDGGQMVCWPWCGSSDTLADARLIAAAPELLAALRTVVVEAQYLLDWLAPEYEPPPVLVEALSAGRAAIAKATDEAAP